MLNSFAVSEPADIGKIGSDEIEVHFPRTGDKCRVGEGQSDVALAKKSGEAGFEPVFVANFDGETESGSFCLFEKNIETSKEWF